jgi:Putative peptidoglycan binding domain
MSIRALGQLSARLAAQWWPLTLIAALMLVFVASYFYVTATHALKSFDSGACGVLAVGSEGGCVSSLQALLDDNQPSSPIAIDGYFGPQTYQAVMGFQSNHQLTADGIVATETGNALNEFSPRPSIFSYASGFFSSRLSSSARLCVTALMATSLIMTLVLKTAHRYSPVFGIRRFRVGFYGALAAATTTVVGMLLAAVHGWVLKALCIALAALAAALLALLKDALINALSHYCLTGPRVDLNLPEHGSKAWMLIGGLRLRPVLAGSSSLHRHRLCRSPLRGPGRHR